MLKQWKEFTLKHFVDGLRRTPLVPKTWAGEFNAFGGGDDDLQGVQGAADVFEAQREAFVWGKLRRGSELTVVESDVIEQVLRERYGLHFERDKTLEIE